MKKQIIIWGLIILIICSIPLSLFGIVFGLPPQFDESYFAAIGIKYKRLTSIKGPKLVIISNSSVAFGIRSDLLEAEIGLPVVNFGYYLSLGTKYMLDVAEKSIREGDIIIIAPEQCPDAFSLDFNGEGAWYSVDGNFHILSEIAKENYRDLAKNFLTFAKNKYKRWINNDKLCPNSVYNINAFNKYGDIIYLRPENILEDYDKDIIFEQNIISKDFIKYLNDYNKRMIKKGATMFFSFCPIMSDSISTSNTEQTIHDYINYVNEVFDLPVIGDINAHILPYELFYDSNFHLNDEGAIKYTAIVAQEIKEALGL